MRTSSGFSRRRPLPFTPCDPSQATVNRTRLAVERSHAKTNGTEPRSAPGNAFHQQV